MQRTTEGEKWIILHWTYIHVHCIYIYIYVTRAFHETAFAHLRILHPAYFFLKQKKKFILLFIYYREASAKKNKTKSIIKKKPLHFRGTSTPIHEPVKNTARPQSKDWIVLELEQGGRRRKTVHQKKKQTLFHY